MFRVMVADDEPIVRKALQMLTNWEDIDCQLVYVASSGKEVIDNIGKTNPDILITDIKMADMTGIEISKYIHENSLPIKIIILTAYADFSYAQSALQYGVVDYVTKTGSFDELLVAIERAKQAILSEQVTENKDNKEGAIENFFKSLVDGSLYDNDEIQLKAKSLEISLFKYIVVSLNFRVDDNISLERKNKINKSLVNFFKMEFSESQPFIVSIRRNNFCVIINCAGDDYEKFIERRCIDICNTVQYFMKLEVCIGISQRFFSLTDFKLAFEQAQIASSGLFYKTESVFNFYDEAKQKVSKDLLKKQGQLTDKLCLLMQTGSKEEALTNFKKLCSLQITNTIPPYSVKQNSIAIINCAKKLVGDAGVSLSVIFKGETDALHIVNSCFHFGQYESIIQEAISKSIDVAVKATNKREMIVSECLDLIENNIFDHMFVSELADSLGVNPSYLSRIFKEKTGDTIINHISAKKIEVAEHYIRNTDMKIYEISEKLGFENTTYFSHFFKKHKHISPIEYKKKFGKGDD